MATIKDVAKRAGVAVSTVSYVINGTAKISEETKKKVWHAIEELGYQKNGFASDLKKTKTNTIALILSDLAGPFYSELTKGVQEVAFAHGYDLIACSAQGGDGSTAVRFLNEKRVDGAIVLAHSISNAVLQKAAAKGTPLVLLDRTLTDQQIVNVEVDNEHGGYMATEHLLQKGHRKLAYVGGPDVSMDAQRRWHGCCRALLEYGINPDTVLTMTGDFTKEGGYRTTKMLLAQGEVPGAIVYANDEMALGGLDLLAERKLRVPEDVSVIGFDDIQLAAYARPPLTTIRQPKYEVGALSVHLLLKKLSGETTGNDHKLSTELIVRESVRSL